MKFWIYCDRFCIYNIIWVVEWWVFDEIVDFNMRFNGVIISRFYGGRKGYCIIDVVVIVRFGWLVFFFVFLVVR